MKESSISIKAESSMFRNRIVILSFAFMVLVMLVHAENLYLAEASQGMGYRLLSSFEYFFGEVLGEVAVPGFFFISGYLFCRSFERQKVGPSMIWAKWKKRIFSLLIPYLIWNLIYYLIYLAFGRAELSLGSLYEALVKYAYNPVFWYMQQLIILSILAPFLYAVFNDGGSKAAIFLLAMIFVVASNYSPEGIHIVNEDALFYYCLGMVSVIFFRDIFEEGGVLLSKIGIAAFLIFMLVTVFHGYFMQSPYAAVLSGSEILRRAGGVLTAWALVFCCTDGKKEPKGFMGINFFIYAVHYLIIRGVNMLLPESLPALFAAYIAMPFICTLVPYGISLILRRFLPKIYLILCGGRQ